MTVWMYECVVMMVVMMMMMVMIMMIFVNITIITRCFNDSHMVTQSSIMVCHASHDNACNAVGVATVCKLELIIYMICIIAYSVDLLTPSFTPCTYYVVV